jgi:hypothetical protein
MTTRQLAADPFDAEAHLEAVAATLGLTIPPDAAEGAVRYLRLAESMAARLMAAPLDPAAFEQAPAFIPGRRGGAA